MEDRETPRIHKHGKIKNNSNYDGNGTSRDFQFGTQKISGRLIFVGQRVQVQEMSQADLHYTAIKALQVATVVHLLTHRLCRTSFAHILLFPRS
jgi:hypothetical protein